MSFEKIDKNNIPHHIAVIMDGNGRWAKKRGMSREYGHRAGRKSVKKIIESCIELGIKNLTLYAFSSENWNRPKIEIDFLMQLLLLSLKGELKNLNKYECQLCGQRWSGPGCQKMATKGVCPGATVDTNRHYWQLIDDCWQLLDDC